MATEMRQELTVRISVLSRPLRLDEIGFECFRGEAPFPAVVLTDYAESNTENGPVGGTAGSFVVDGPNGLEVLSPVEFGQKFTFEANGVTAETPDDDDGFVQDLDGAQQDEDPATAEKDVVASAEFAEGDDETDPGGEVGAPADDAEVELVIVEPPADVEPTDPEETDAEPPSETEEGEEETAEADDEATVSQFESLSDNELWDVANDLEIEAGSVGRAELIALIDAAVAEAENATEASE